MGFRVRMRSRRHRTARVSTSIIIGVTGIGVTGVVALSILNTAAAQDYSKVEIRSLDLGSGLYMLMGRGGNIGVSTGPDGTFLIDDQFAPLTPKIVAAVAKLSPNPVEFVLNTHWHGDHTGGNEALAGGGALVVAHEAVHERMSRGGFSKTFDREIPPAAPGALPVVTFDSSIRFHLNGLTIRALHVDSAHTDGDSIVYFEGANVIHMGDTYFNGIYPFIDLESGGSLAGVLAAVEKVLTEADAETKIIPGHGPLSNSKELAAYFEMLTSVQRAVAEAQAAGKSRDEVIASRPTAAYDAAWGGGFLPAERFVGIVYDGVAMGHPEE